jgi:putative membrane protein
MHVGGGNALAMGVTGLLFLALLAGLTLLMLQDRPGNSLGPPTGPESQPASRPSPEQVLAERFARGEIDATEYRYRLAILARRRPPHPTHPAGRGSPR